MSKIVSVLFTLAFVIDASRLNHLRRLRGDSDRNEEQRADLDRFVVDPIDSDINDQVYCVGTKPLTTKPPFRKFLGLHRYLDLPIRSRTLTCEIEWFFEDIGAAGVDTHNFSLYTMTKESDLWLSALPDRLSPIDEEPEKFTLLNIQNCRIPTKNIISHYAGHEFNGWSLLCHTNDELIYKQNTETNQNDEDCQWQFIAPIPVTTDSPTDSPTTHAPTSSPIPVTTDSPITTASICYTEDNNPCWRYSGSDADYAYFASCTSCCHFIHCDNGRGRDQMCAPGAYWNPNAPNNQTSNGCQTNNDQCFDSGKDSYGRDFTCSTHV